jgi:hypothetical protein
MRGRTRKRRRPFLDFHSAWSLRRAQSGLLLARLPAAKVERSCAWPATAIDTQIAVCLRSRRTRNRVEAFEYGCAFFVAPRVQSRFEKLGVKNHFPTMETG